MRRETVTVTLTNTVTFGGPMSVSLWVHVSIFVCVRLFVRHIVACLPVLPSPPCRCRTRETRDTQNHSWQLPVRAARAPGPGGMAAAWGPAPGDVAGAVLAAYGALGKAGKPQAWEHTVLAGFLVARPPPGPGPALQVVALATGTKCLPAAQRRPHGDVLNDSHAEVDTFKASSKQMHLRVDAFQL